MAAHGNQYSPGMMSQQSSAVPYSSGGMMSASQQSMMSGSQPGINVSSQQNVMVGSQQGMVGQGPQGMMGGGQHGISGSSQSHMGTGQQGMMGGGQQGMMGSQQSMAGSGQQSMIGGGGSQSSMTSGSQQSMMGGHSQGVMGSGSQSQMTGQLAGGMHQAAPLISPTKDVNAITLCKKGQECVQDIVSKVTDILRFLQTKSNPLPNGANTNALQDRRNKLNENLDQLSVFFRMLRVLYNKVNEVCPDQPSEEALIPYVGQPVQDTMSPTVDHFKSRIVMEEKRELVEQLLLKNRQLKAVIDQLRTIVWEINTMIVMRKS